MSLSIKLSTRNFFEASKISGNDEFSFIIGDEKMSCHKFVAAFLSHSISQILQSDPTVESFYINLGNQNTCEENRQKQAKIQSYLQNLIYGGDIEISEEDIQTFISQLDNVSKNTLITDLPSTNISSLLILNQSLKNEEITDKIYHCLISFLLSDFKKEDKEAKNQTKEEISQKFLQIQKVEKFLNLIEKTENYPNNFVEYLKKYLEKEYIEIIDEIASHFYEIDENIFFEMNENFLNSILSSQKLKIENEDHLLNVLLNRREYILSIQQEAFNDYHHFLIEKVGFEYLSEEGIKRFLNEIELDEISLDVWSQIKRRLILPVQVKPNKKQTGTQFKFNGSKPFCGILDHLSKISKGNIHENNTVEFKASSHSCGKFKELVDFQNESGNYHVNGSPNPRWIQIDFKERKVQIDSYLIKSGHTRNNSCNIYYLKSWKIEISSDGKQWNYVDERTSVSELDGNYKMHLFNLNKLTEPFRFIRIITDKENWCDDESGFSIGKLEFYGNIIEK